MPDDAVLFTGAGGFLGRYILRHYLDRGDRDLFLLENGLFCKRLNDFLDGLKLAPEKRARIKVLEGDITVPDLKLGAQTAREVKDRTTHVIHLAALYNLSAPRDVSVRINVDGTRNVLDFAEACPNLKRFGHMSTFAVSGAYTGLFTEADFDKGQEFKNFYEETKFLSEKLVRERWNRIPTVIGRPTIVVGHSKTGAIEKIDGPYYVFVMISRCLHFLMVRCGKVRCHIAPVDYVTDGFYTIFEEPGTEGKAYCFGDPNPMLYDDFFDLVCEHWPRFKPLLRLPPSIMKYIFGIPLMDKITGVTHESFMYAGGELEVSVSNARSVLGPKGIDCPPVSAYVDVMIKYFREHAHDAAVRRGNWKRGTT